MNKLYLGIAKDSRAVAGGNKVEVSYCLNAIEYAKMLHRLYDEWDEYITSSPSRSFAMSAYHENLRIGCEYTLDYEEPVDIWSLYESARGVGRASSKNGLFGIIYPQSVGNYRHLRDQIHAEEPRRLFKQPAFKKTKNILESFFVSSELKSVVDFAFEIMPTEKSPYREVKQQHLVLVGLYLNKLHEDAQSKGILYDEVFHLDPHIMIVKPEIIKWVTNSELRE